MTSAFPWLNSVSLWPASFHTSRPNLPVTSCISWLPTFAFQSHIMKRTSFFWVLILEGLVGFRRTVQLQFLQHYRSGHRLGLLWLWIVCLGNRSFCHFLDASTYCISDSFADYDGYSISSKGFLPTVEKQWKQWETFWVSKITTDGDCSHDIKKDAYSLEVKLWST